MANTTRTQIPAEVSNVYNKKLLYRAIPLFVHGLFAQQDKIGSRKGSNVMKWRRYGNLSSATTALTEGTTPAGSQLSTTLVDATALQYGDFVTVTDVVSYLSPDAVLMEAAQILGDQAGQTMDDLTKDVLTAGTGVYYSGTGNTATDEVAAGDVLTQGNIQTAVTALKNASAKKITSYINPQTGDTTQAVKRAFVGINHVNMTPTIEAMADFIPVTKYGNMGMIHPNEIGMVKEVRFIETENADIFVGGGTGSIDVYPTLIMGADAYGITKISGQELTNIVKPLGSAGTADPLNQRATSGWKATFVAKILNDAFIKRIESALV